MTYTLHTTPAPLVTREALAAITQRLVERFAPDKVTVFGSLAPAGKPAGIPMPTFWW